MTIARTAGELRLAVKEWRASGMTVGFVPTMGALHQGHLDLVREAARIADRVVVSIFVNPTQFGPGEDFDKYPRTLDSDCALLEPAGAHLVFAPTPSSMYPDGFQTRVELDLLPAHLCGLTRTHHFGGVALVVLKLLNLCAADLAVFGEKDFQQVRVIERMVLDLDVPVRIVRHPTVREPDGLAMSSRNRYLSADERARAACLFRTLSFMADAVTAGHRDAPALVAEGRRLIRNEGLELEYLSICDPETLDEVDEINGPVRIAVAARLGGTRLIDNVAAVHREAG
jgi:pantoate--beta-alanine ligase